MASPVRTDIACVAASNEVLDCLILYESLLETWTSTEFTLHVFGDDAAERLGALGLERLRVHRAAEQPRFERCIVTEPGNVFLAETPELALLLAEHDLVVAAEGSLWASRNPNVLEREDWDHAVKVTGEGAVLDAGLAGLSLQRDWLGFREARLGRVKVVRMAGLPEGSPAGRVDAIVERFPRIAPLLPYYLVLAERAAERLGLERLPNSLGYARERLLEAGFPASRNELPELLNRRGLEGTGVEIGVKRGLFSEALLRGWRGRKLISIDPWREAPAGDYVDVANVAQADQDRFHDQTVARLEPFGERSEIWRTTSSEAAGRFEPESLDFVYLDARHDYDSVKDDLEAWFPRVRPGGVLAGHDYLDGVLPEGDFGVRSAVDDFFAARGLEVRETYFEPGTRAGPPRTWLVELRRSD